MSGRRGGGGDISCSLLCQCQCTDSPVQCPCCTGLVKLYNTLALVVRDKAAEEVRMVLLYQLDCHKVLDLLEDNVAVSEEQFSDYWADNNMRWSLLRGAFLSSSRSEFRKEIFCLINT